LYSATTTYFNPSFVVIFTSFVVNDTINSTLIQGFSVGCLKKNTFFLEIGFHFIKKVYRELKSPSHPLQHGERDVTGVSEDGLIYQKYNHKSNRIRTHKEGRDPVKPGPSLLRNIENP
jgi:hypothetical protein